MVKLVPQRSLFSAICNGVNLSPFFFASFSWYAIWPTCVAIPALLILAFPRPFVADVDMKHTFFENGSSRSATTSTFRTSPLSPVNSAALAKTSIHSIRRQSAGRPSPVATSITPPGANSVTSSWRQEQQLRNQDTRNTPRNEHNV